MFIAKKISRNGVYLLIASSGFAALSWEVIWQIKATLALGLSAQGTAITLMVIMGGMGIGGLLMGNFIRHCDPIPSRSIRIYGLLELITGCAGLFLNTAFSGLEKFDTWVYTLLPNAISFVYLIGIVSVLSIPALCMGATIPLFTLLYKQYQAPIAKLYFLNTLGAAIGILFIVFMLIPCFGITHTIWIIAAINTMISVIAYCLGANTFAPMDHEICENNQNHHFLWQPSKILFLVFVTGFTTFVLEVAWFRSFQSLFPNTTDIFAILLACMLIAISLAAKNVSILKKNNKCLGTQVCIAGILILLITPLLERFDFVLTYSKQIAAAHVLMMHSEWQVPVISIPPWLSLLLYLLQTLLRFFIIYLIIVPPIRYLSVAFPWIIDNQHAASTIGKLYAVNTFAAMLGSICAAWLLLPIFGFVKTAWLAGVLIILSSITLTSGRKRVLLVMMSIAALICAMMLETGIGEKRVQGYFATDELGKPATVLASYEGPDVTTSAVAYQDGTHALLINSMLAAWDGGEKKSRPSMHYMAWMGYMPMLLHPNPKNALVICFGTGQTANAVRNENPQSLDIVDINPNVFLLAHYFKSNEDVLHDPRVQRIVMDGRAYLRRTQKMYDVITLEPMPPSAIGVNALYSKEFYQFARSKLAAQGIIAQWLPFHLVSSHYTASIANTFISVFPNAILWIDPDSKTGILLASKDEHAILEHDWPGLLRTNLKRNLSATEIKQNLALNTRELEQYSAYGDIISDDNQLLSYGKVLYPADLLNENLQRLHNINNKINIPQLNQNYR